MDGCQNRPKSSTEACCVVRSGEQGDPGQDVKDRGGRKKSEWYRHRQQPTFCAAEKDGHGHG
jgi:hypothetical protein